MPFGKFRHAFVALLVVVLLLGQVTWALAGTTGGISGSVTDTATGKGVAAAQVTASSPSQTVTTTTDAAGHFTFLSLAPDTYTVSVAKNGVTPASIAGVSVFADQTQTIALTTSSLKNIATVTSRSAGNLVKAGVTADVYSVNAQTQQTIAAMGGGYNMNTAYSAIYSQPGVSSYIGNYGQGQTFYIRGASYGETGYEFDGVPVNRAFDNYNGNTLSNLGQQELQVYTGGSPASGSSATLGGYINQVIRTGTYPGFGTANLGIGSPTFYHQLQLEAGGASPNRLFSYYVGVQGYGQGYRVMNNQNGGNIDIGGNNPYGFFGTGGNAYALFNTGFYTAGPIPTCGPGLTPPAGAPTNGFAGKNAAQLCYNYGPYAAGYDAFNTDREVVANIHIGIPHKHDGGKDDIQFLFDNGSAHTQYADSINDLGGLAAFQNMFSFIDPNLNNSACYMIGLARSYGYSNGVCANGGPSPFPYQDAYIFPTGTAFGQSAAGLSAVPYYFPSSPTNRPLFSGIPLDSRGGIYNDVGIFKAQYQKNFGSNAYARVYGYTFYSDWMQNNPQEASLYYALAGFGFGASGDYPSPDYELFTHTRGFSVEYANQINASNLLRLTGNYVTAGVNRFNNQSWLATGLTTSATNLMDASGNCYDYRSTVANPAYTPTNGQPKTIPNPNVGGIGSCFSSSTSGTYGAPTRGLAGNACGTPYLAGTAACAANANWLVTRPQGKGTLNQVTPKFTTVALEDEYKPNDKLSLNFGVRLEKYEYDLASINDPQYTFWFNAAQNVFCYDPVTLQPMLNPITPAAPPPASAVTTAPGAACPVAPSGQPGVHPNGKNGAILYSGVSPGVLSHTVFSPRIGGTYALNADTVLRFTLGKYTQPTPTAFEQYLDQYGRSAAANDFSRFFGFGFYNPSHDNPVQTSNNADFSLEKRLKGTDVTLKLSPFYRYTTHQSVTVPLGPNFVSAVNLGTQRSSGVEFQVQKGNPNANGWSGSLSYTYTNAKIRYENAPNGRNTIDLVNDYIKAYNGLTKAGGGSPCYDPNNPAANGTNGASNCSTAGEIVNPYYNLAAQPLLDRAGWYPTYPNSPPHDAGSSPGLTALSPNFFSGWLSYKHDKLQIAPNFELAQGNAYGSPISILGIDPRTCGDNQAGANGAGAALVAANSPYAQYANYATCQWSLNTNSGYLAIPNPYTGAFDSEGKYTNPWQINVGAMIKYDVSNKVTATLNLANIFNRCFGGTKTPWSSAFPANNYVCGYAENGTNFVGTQPGAGFFFGGSPHDTVNGTSGYPHAFDYPYGTLNGALPFQAYLNVQIKL